MLFTYNKITDPIFEIQKQLDFLFNEVWLTASGEFDADKLNANPGLKQIYIDFGNVDYDPNDPVKKYIRGKTAYFFNSSIEKIFECFSNINDVAFKEDLKKRYAYNNSIEKLCVDKTISPISYQDIESKYPDLAKELNSFYSKLYDNDSPYTLVALGNLHKTLLPQYDKAFMAANTNEICPFCGINHLKGNNHSYKEAYDHYLPKALYPFNSLNFENLAPMCHECNSTYKLTKLPIYNSDPKKIDPILRENFREKAFFPYAKWHPKINFSIKLKTKDVKKLKPDLVDIFITNSTVSEEIASWKRVFGIEERYKALLCSQNGGVSWFTLVYDELENASVLKKVAIPYTYYKMKLRETRTAPLTDHGFLKGPFLEECRKFGAIPNVWRNWFERFKFFRKIFHALST